MNLTPCARCDWYRRGGSAGDDCDMHRRLTALANNLSIGAGLCLAFDLGGLLVPDESYEEASRWSPGCGLAAP